MTSSPQVREAAAELAKTFGGTLMLPGDPGYDEARRVHNGMIDKHPALVARPRGTADIAQAVRFGRAQGLEIAVKGGGHNVAGRATVEGGLLIDLSGMRGIFVDPRLRTARAQGGATWGDFNRETQVHGLASTGGLISTTGVSGLTLGGGIGWLTPLYGLSLDNLLSVELVTADGSVVNASASEHPDLFWALRGGGGNFGVAASLEFRLYPVGPMLTGGILVHPFERAREVFRFLRKVTADLPEEMGVYGGLTHAPDGSGTKVCALLAAHFGSPEEGAKALAPLKAFGPPIVDAIGPISYEALNRMVDARYPRGARNYWKSAMMPSLGDQAIDTMIESFARVPSSMSGMIIEHFHGKFCRVGATDTAFPHRAASYNFLVLSQWEDAAQDAANVAWARDTFSALNPFLSKGHYVNYLGEDEARDGVAAAYGPNFERLQRIKDVWDPDNVFHLNQNIRT